MIENEVLQLQKDVLISTNLNNLLQEYGKIRGGFHT